MPEGEAPKSPADAGSRDPPSAPDQGVAGPAAAPTAAALEAELRQMKDKWMRARADYDNLQRRVVRDAELERERARGRVLEGILPVFELAQMAAHQTELHPSPVTEGVVLMAREFARLLEREGLVPIGAVGEAFDARHHEAVAEEAAEGVEPGRVSRVVLPGYRLGDRVLRHAKVTVAPRAS